MARKKPTAKSRITVIEGTVLEGLEKAPPAEEVTIAERAAVKSEGTNAAQQWITSEPKNKSKGEAMAKKKPATKRTATSKRPNSTGKKPSGETITSRIRKHAADHPETTKQEISDAVGTKNGNGHQALCKKKSKASKCGSKAGAANKADHNTSSSNGHTASEFIKARLGIGLDKAINLLTAVKKAIR